MAMARHGGTIGWRFYARPARPIAIQIVTNFQPDTAESSRSSTSHKQRSTIWPNMRRTPFIYCSLSTRLFLACALSPSLFLSPRSVPGIHVTWRSFSNTAIRIGQPHVWQSAVGSQLDVSASALCCACVWLGSLRWLDWICRCK